MNKSLSLKSNKKTKGFTIVELLVVIVVIGILAAISIITYAGISQKAVSASLQSDLSSASTMLKNFQIDNSSYPTTISTNCTTNPDTSTNKCLKVSPGTTYNYIPGSASGSNYLTFTLTATNPSLSYSYVITENTKPVALAPAPLSPVADWLATTQGDHYGNYYDLVGKSWATVTRAGTKTVYDSTAQKIFDVPANYLGIAPRSDGKSGVEATIEEGRTNILLNSDFEIDSNSDGTPDNWGGPVFYAGGTGAATIDASQSVHQSKSYKITKTNEIGQVFAVTTPTINTANTYTYSCWVKSNTTSAYIDTYTGTGWSSTNVPSDQLNQWTRISTTFAATAPSDTRVAIYGASGIAYFDDCQLEVGSFATSYIPTSASAVTRNADVVTVPTATWNPNVGSMLSVIGSAPDNSVSVDHIIFGWGTGGANRLFAEQWGGTTLLSSQGAIGRQTANTIRPASGTHTFAGSWNSGSPINSYIDGGNKISSGGNSDNLSSMPATANLGSYFDNTYPYDSTIQRFTVYTSVLSDSGILSTTNSIKDGP
jgi:prepilin-type N-terminal cleavage/methylation domain-containing protein